MWPGCANGIDTMTPGFGHNNGPTIEPGATWRRTAWARARADLLPVLPIEVVRLRVKRAQELGLPYKTYAGIRASTGHDLIGFLFSSNALGIIHLARLDSSRAEKLAGVNARRVAVVHRPLAAADVVRNDAIDSAHAAPRFIQSWSAMRDTLRDAIRAEGQPADRFLLIGETAFERDWSGALKAAGFLSGDTYFRPIG
jgi:hypothetical protein